MRPLTPLLFLLLAGACAEPRADRSTPAQRADSDGLSDGGDTETDGGEDGGGTGEDTLPDDQWDAFSRAYQTCVTEADCDAGSACTEVSGYGTAYCAPACDPEGDASECDPEGLLGAETWCSSSGRCVRACEDDTGTDTCPEDLACQDDEGWPAPVCAGEEAGKAGYYGTCTHPMVEGIDCPPESSCFGGDIIGVETGVCLPWCDDGLCEPVPDSVSGVSPVCYDVGLDHPVCALICVPDSSTCPEGQACSQVSSSLGLCIPEGASF